MERPSTGLGDPATVATTALDVFKPGTLDEAIRILDTYGDGAKVIAGSTALAIMLRQRLIAPDALVCIGHLGGLDRVRADDGTLHLGALATHRQVETSPVVRAHLPVVADTFGQVANVRVRNAATVGGVMAEADYASDPPATLLALDAEIDVAGPGGTRTIPVDELFLAFYETSLEPSEIITGVRVPLLPADAGAVYLKYVTRSSEDRPCAGAAAVVRLAPDGRTCAELRLAMGAVAETPQRFPELEAAAVGRELTSETAAGVAAAYADAIDTLDDMRGSAWYRREMVRVWGRRAIERATAAAVAKRASRNGEGPR